MSADRNENNLVTLILKYGSEVAGDIYASAIWKNFFYRVIVQDHVKFILLELFQATVKLLFDFWR